MGDGDTHCSDGECDTTVFANDESSYSDTYNEPDRCYNDYFDSSNWTYRLNGSIVGDHENPVNIPEQMGYTAYIHSWFEDLPEKMTLDCDFESRYGTVEPAPFNVDLAMKSYDKSKLSLFDMKPDEHSSSDTDQFEFIANLGLTVVGAFVTTPLTSGALAAFSWGMSNIEDIDPSNKHIKQNGEEEFAWNIGLPPGNYKESLPSSADNSLGVQGGIFNKELSPGAEQSIYLTSEYTFSLPTLAGYCPCEDLTIINKTASAYDYLNVEG